MNMKVKLRAADETIIELKRSRLMWKNLAIIFGCGIIALSVVFFGRYTS